jgi:hypothetical protein
VFANLRCNGPVKLGKLCQRLADDLELALHGGAEHGVLLVVLKAFARREFRQSLGCLLNVVQVLFASSCIDQGLRTFNRITEVGISDSRSNDQVHWPREELLQIFKQPEVCICVASWRQRFELNNKVEVAFAREVTTHCGRPKEFEASNSIAAAHLFERSLLRGDLRNHFYPRFSKV